MQYIKQKWEESAAQMPPDEMQNSETRACFYCGAIAIMVSLFHHIASGRQLEDFMNDILKETQDYANEGLAQETMQ